MSNRTMWLRGAHVALGTLGVLALAGCYGMPAGTADGSLAVDQAGLCFDCDPLPEPDPDPTPTPVADLRLHNGSTRNPYCVIAWSDDRPHLGVEVNNTGSADAPSSTLRVRFNASSGASESFLTVPALAAGGGRYIWVPVPGACWDLGSCDFELEVDQGHVVTESSESNNLATGMCELF